MTDFPFCSFLYYPASASPLRPNTFTNLFFSNSLNIRVYYSFRLKDRYQVYIYICVYLLKLLRIYNTSIKLLTLRHDSRLPSIMTKCHRVSEHDVLKGCVCCKMKIVTQMWEETILFLKFVCFTKEHTCLLLYPELYFVLT